MLVFIRMTNRTLSTQDILAHSKRHNLREVVISNQVFIGLIMVVCIRITHDYNRMNRNCPQC